MALIKLRKTNEAGENARMRPSFRWQMDALAGQAIPFDEIASLAKASG